MAREIKSNPFLDDDDVDDNEFLNHPRQGKSGYILSNNSAGSEQNQWEIRRQQLLEERRRIEERTLQSTNNSIGLLHESEQVGILTAEELVKQREQLENIEENLDFINSTMRTSQKHINSLKNFDEYCLVALCPSDMTPNKLGFGNKLEEMITGHSSYSHTFLFSPTSSIPQAATNIISIDKFFPTPFII
ncbi:synaptosomal-associated protein 29 [Trichonephila clavata]|uniref:Synaptosomal-associated protein 29 n=1 Tax=Trichonephila clavata TaxID=2740835 RepID=A0A8X6J2X8_TRICU|nr:synaptosomal-associated protein 29 [Trichonephila clavata]